ncbi:ras guanine nucleotide exchange factor domain-containing protein [Absidia repens]|uniref:Ras guanine nucleotide exchange factor domain-containing protein n=1 Tax=Absidia repens TaxID=90262 RepID=A0A1X2IXI2_9FUNG|nr:ras guanine nucleotide exchange factor domain-containing protein [Absidia repens]
MWFSQRISAINKQLKKPTKSHSSTFPTKSTRLSSPSHAKSLEPNKPISPPFLPETTATTPPSSPLFAHSNEDAATKITPKTTETTAPAQVALYTQNIPLEILVIGASQAAKLAVIRLAFGNIRSVSSKYKGGHTFQANLEVDHSIYHLDLVKMDYANAIDSKNDTPKIRNDFIHFDGIIVCYDINDHNSTDCLPDLLSAFLAWKIPTFLVSLRTTTATTTITDDVGDPQIGKKLAALYGTPFVMIDGTTPGGETQMQTIYTALVQKIIYPQKRTSSLATNASRRHHHSSTAAPQLSLQEQQHSTRKRNSNKQAVSSSSASGTTLPTKRDTAVGRKSSSSSTKKSHHRESRLPRSEHRYDLLALASLDGTTPTSAPDPSQAQQIPASTSPEPTPLHDPLTGMFTPPLSPVSPTTAYLPLISPETNDNSGTYSVNDFNNTVPLSEDTDLTADDIVKKLILWDYHDQETSTLIFLMFYRKFMTPYQLLQSLIERFEQNYGCDHQPTREQERIRTILCLWLSHYWGDIYYGRSHQTLNSFLQRLGHNPQLRTMYQLLVPLITRPGPLSDPDSVWGLTDDERESDDGSPTSDDNNNNNFSSLWTHSPSITTMLSMSTSFQSLANKYSPPPAPRSSSSTLLDWYAETDNEDHHPFSTTTHALVSTSPSNSSSQPALSTTSSSSMDSYDTLSSYNSRSKRSKDKKRSNLSTAKGTKRRSSKRPADGSTLFGGGLVLLETAGRRPFSLLALQSSLHSMSHIRYAMLMDLSVDLLAEQLTWVELTLYRNIKPRDYIRHLWGEKGASEAMVAFISHGQFIKGWVMTMILMQKHHCQRMALVEKFVDLAYRFYHDYRNYNTLASVLEGLGQVMTGVHHDNNLLLELDQVKQQQWQELETLMKADRNYVLYRQDLEFSNDGSSIPYLWVHRHDIVTLAEMKRDMTLCGGIHWDKFRFMGEIILQLTNTITLATTTQPNPCVLAFISDTTLLTEDERICRLDELREK